MTRGWWWAALLVLAAFVAWGMWWPGWWLGPVGLAAGAWLMRRSRPERARFEPWLRHSKIGWVVTDLAGRVVWANPGFERLTGYPLAVADGVRLLGLLDAIGAEPDTLRTIEERTRSGEPYGVDVLALRRDGRRFWLRLEGDALRDAQGVVTGTSVLLGDAEVRVQAVRGLQRGQRILQAVAAASEHLLRSARWSDAVPFVLERLGQAGGAPRVALLAFHGREVVERGAWGTDGAWGAPDASLALRAWEELPRGEPRLLEGGEGFPAPAGSAVAPVVAGGQVWGQLCLYPPGEGGWGEVDVLAFGSAAAAIGAAIDREEGEAALARERSFAEQVLEGVIDGVAVIGAAGDVAYANRALLRMLARPRGEVYGAPWAALLPTEGEVDRGKAFAQYEVSSRQPGGTRTLHVREVAGVVGDREVRRIAVLTDITDRKRLEAGLAEAVAVATAASEAKTRFLGQVSHELRTPLHAMLGFAQLAGMDAATAEVAEAVREIRRAGGHLGRLIDDLIDVSSAETGDLRVASERVDLTDVVREALRMIAPVAQAAGVGLEEDVADGVFTLGDRQRVLQVVLNLLDNAVRYAEVGGQVSVRLDDAARLEVEDDGIGIPAGDVARLFTPFERLANARDRQGTGIGLALSRLLVERMGGTIGVHSGKGRGSVFWVAWAPTAEGRPRGT